MRLRCKILAASPPLMERYMNTAARLTWLRRLSTPLIVIHIPPETTTPTIVWLDPNSPMGSTTTSRRVPKKSIMALVILPRLTLSLCWNVAPAGGSGGAVKLYQNASNPLAVQKLWSPMTSYDQSGGTCCSLLGSKGLCVLFICELSSYFYCKVPHLLYHSIKI